jgi:peptidoglycan hydrolase-like protein with peptidoglycan-binding domain
LPTEFLWLKTPNIKGPQVVALQRALAAKGIDPGPIDGEYGPMTNAAVVSFQVVEGLEVDGVVGPETADALGLSFPIAPASQDSSTFKTVQTPRGETNITFPPPDAFDGIVDISQSGKVFRAKTASGFSFIIGSATNFTDDMHRTGLFQGKTSIADSEKFGAYKAAEFTQAFGQWAHFIEPTLSAEGGARFATLNSYDRAGFTFGAPQLAAHTPGENFIIYLRELLSLPDADKHFPELSLRPNGARRKAVHLKNGQGFVNLEEVIEVTRPNGKKEKQLPRLIAYLNSSPIAVDQAELSAAARLMNWLRLDPKAKELQIRVFIGHAQEKLDRAGRNIAGFSGRDWRTSLWVMDIMHQGRGTFREMSRAHQTSNPEAALQQIGLPKYRNRIRTVAAEIQRLAASGVMNGFSV